MQGLYNKNGTMRSTDLLGEKTTGTTSAKSFGILYAGYKSCRFLAEKKTKHINQTTRQ